MRPKPVRSWTIWAGAGLAALGHGALVALALIGPPWLSARRERPPETITVALVAPAELAALEAAARAAAAGVVRVAPPPPEPAAKPAAPTTRLRTAPPPAAPPAPQAAAPDAAAPDAAGTEAPEAELPESLAPAFNADAPLGIGRADAAAGPAASRAEIAAAQAAFGAAVQAAITDAQTYPDAALARGAAGRVRLAVLVTRTGRLLAAQLVTSSGDPVLDTAAIAAVRSAALPAMPEGMPQARASIVIDLTFAPRPVPLAGEAGGGG